MQQIVAATDFSLRSEIALLRAARLACQSGAKLVLVHVVDDDQPSTLVDLERREAQRLLDEKIKGLPALAGLDCRAAIVTGDAFSGVLSVAEKVSADLIVMGSHRKALLRDVFIGTTLERVIRTGPFPVLLVNREADRAYRRALAAVDLSEPSVYALKTAVSLGLATDAEIVVLHTFIAPSKAQLLIGNAEQEQIDAYVAGETRRSGEELAAFLDGRSLGGKRWDYRVEEGEAAESIVRAVGRLDADLLIVGTHGRSGLAKLMLGSVAETLLRRLDNADILAVPLPKARA
jgi:universal stress protein E